MTPPPLTWLYAPGDRPHVVAKALVAGADVVVVDLEDAVAPDRKEYARAATAELLSDPQPVPVHVRVNAVLQPEFFVEIGEALAKEKGIAPGAWVRVDSKRGYIRAKAVVTKRIKPLVCDGKTVHIVGIPIHWGFIGQTRKGFGVNTLTPFVGDANIETPEFKAFLVDIKAENPPVA